VTLSGTASGVPRGGAFAMTAGTTAKFTRCLFMGNSYTAANGAVRGGAVGIVAAVGEFRQCRFLGNSITSGSDGDGGAVATISTGARATFLNCLFNANSASHDGGAVELNGTLASELRNCTLSGNSAGTAAGGLRVSSSGPVSLLNSILWDNRVGPTQNEAAQVAFTGSALPASTLSSNDIEGWTGALGGAGNFSQDPDFTDPNGFDNIAGNLDDFLHLLPTSPCIDSGNNGNVLAEMTLDLAGRSRRQDDLCTVDTGVGTGSIVDRGAYEFQGDCVSGVGDPPAGGGRAFRVGLPAPNPTAGAVTLTFALPAAGAVRAAVYDVAGRRVRVLVHESFEAGEHAIRWNGSDDDDRPVAGGLYFVRVEAAGRAAVRKVVVR
jgi:predicted outer membrane repeat protein